MTARRLRRKNKPDVKRFLYVPLPMFVVFASVEIRRKMSNGASRCRNRLNYVERQRTLLVRWQKARNTPTPQQWIAETKDRLAQRRGKEPVTKAGQLRALWPEIRAAKAEGQSLATIRQWLKRKPGSLLLSEA
jgi:hypothetical protein